MKNVHLIPTDKPSRLCYDRDDNLLFAPNAGWNIADGKQNIYITNDEEIKDCYYLVANSVQHTSKAHPSIWNNKHEKIILTTDQDLINDGVQAIDDKFLEWFVKNPTCEEVEVDIEKYVNLTSNPIPIYKIIIPSEELNPCKDIVINDKATVDVPFHNKHIRFENLTSEQANYLSQVSEFYQLNNTRRSAVVPQEEPNYNMKEEIFWISNNPQCKQIETCYNSLSKKCICPKEQQETLEEAAEIFYSEQSKSYEDAIEPIFDNSRYLVAGFIEGAKWQQERMYSGEQPDYKKIKQALVEMRKVPMTFVPYERMYSEEEVIELLTARCKHFGTTLTPFRELLLKQDLEWFEQHKKK